MTDGRLFRSVGKGGRFGERLDPSQVRRIVKTMRGRPDCGSVTRKRGLGPCGRVQPTARTCKATITGLPDQLKAPT